MSRYRVWCATVLGLLPALLLLTPGTGRADPVASGQRELFRGTDAALAAGNRTAFVATQALLRNYPLYPYLLARDLEQRLGGFPVTEVRAFLRDHPDLPPADRLRRSWLTRLAEARRWDDFLQDYRAGNDIALDCHRRQALLSQGRRDVALDGIEAVWLHGASRPTACDPVFAVWRERGGVTQERVWQRFELAMAAGQAGLGGYLRNQLQGERRAAAELWLQVEDDPRRVLDTSRFAADSPYTAPILLHGLLRWSSRDSVAAAAAHDTLQQRYRLPRNAAWGNLQQRLALFVASRGHLTALERLDALPEHLVDESVEEWRVRVALSNQDWPLALRQLERMSPTAAERPQWRYWQARALAASGADRQAQEIYRELSGLRDYHGFLAADRLDLPYRINHSPAAVAAPLRQGLEAQPGILRARELYLLQRLPEARVEWERALAGADTDRLRAAARLADDWRWHDRAIVALGRTGDWDDLELRFPLPYRNELIDHARARAIDPAWVYAVTRQESLFQADARSGAGALGLMQILPTTGQTIAGELGVSWGGNHSLLQAPTNLRFGTYYLRRSLDRLQSHPLLATAAYNAGSSRVVNWLPQQAPMAADVWAETIPYYETRDYVKRVMEYAVVYDWRLGGTQQRLSARLPLIQPRS